MDTLTELTEKFRSVWPLLDERTRRIMAASEARALGHGGVSLVRRACGLSRKAISKGIREIEAGFAPLAGRIRRPGAGRKPLTVADPGLVERLEEMVDVQTGVTRSLRCVGFARARGPSRKNWPGTNTRSVIRRWPKSFTPWTTVSRAIGRPEEGKDHPDRDAPVSAHQRHREDNA